MHSVVGGFMLGIAALHLLTTGSFYINDGADEFSSSLPFVLAILTAFLVDESVRHASYRWIPTEEQLKPSVFGEVMFPMLFDGSSDCLSGSLLFFGLTLQYLFTGIAIGNFHCFLYLPE